MYWSRHSGLALESRYLPNFICFFLFVRARRERRELREGRRRWPKGGGGIKNKGGESSSFVRHRSGREHDRNRGLASAPFYESLAPIQLRITIENVNMVASSGGGGASEVQARWRGPNGKSTEQSDEGSKEDNQCPSTFFAIAVALACPSRSRVPCAEESFTDMVF